MAIQLKDRIYTNCTTIGKADIEVGATKEGYQGWEAVTDGSTVYYCITEDINWEVGYGVKTGTEIVRNLLSSNSGSLLSLDGKASVFCTYPSEKAVFLNADDNIYFPSSNVTANNFVGKGMGITNINADANNLAPEAPTDGETYARNNKTWVSISESAGIPDAPVDGLQYGRQDGEWTEVESSDGYTKAEIDAQQDAQDTKITVNNDEIARQQIEITNNTANITKNDNAINTNITNIATNTGNISSNTSAIGTLSGQVSQNSEDIAELQDSIFFSSAYSADYPSSPNRDPEDGNMYLQKFAMFTYSYAEATQIFCSKTDESGNVRQFTAVQAGDSIVLNEVDSPNYGRYELVSIEDVSDSYVVMNVIPKKGQGTVITGVKVAFQAFPKPDSGGGSIWTEVDGVAVYDGDIEVNGVTVGKGKGTLNTVVGDGALSTNTSGGDNTAVGNGALRKNEGSRNTSLGYNSLTNVTDANNSVAIGASSLGSFETGVDNIAIGKSSASTLTSGNNNVVIGTSAQPSSATVSNEVTIGNNDVTKTRLKGSVSATLDNSEAQSNTAQPKTTMLLTNPNGDDGTGDNHYASLGFNVASGATSQGFITYSRGGDNIGKFVFSQRTGGSTYATQMTIGGSGLVTLQDIKVNGVTIGQGKNSGANNTALGRTALNLTTSGFNNVAVGYDASGSLTEGQGNTTLGYIAGNSITTGNNNLVLGNSAQPSSATVSNEVTIGNSSVTKVRMGNGDLIYPMSSPILYTSILGTQADLPNGATVSLPFVGTGWSGDAFIVPKTGIYFLDASFQWSLINPISNQIYRNAYLGKNNQASFFQTSMGVDVGYPYGSINEFTWIGELTEGDAVRISAQQANVNEEEQNIPAGFNNTVYANWAFLGTGDASSYVANKLVQQLATKVDKLEQKVKALK